MSAGVMSNSNEGVIPEKLFDFRTHAVAGGAIMILAVIRHLVTVPSRV